MHKYPDYNLHLFAPPYLPWTEIFTDAETYTIRTLRYKQQCEKLAAAGIQHIEKWEKHGSTAAVRKQVFILSPSGQIISSGFYTEGNEIIADSRYAYHEDGVSLKIEESFAYRGRGGEVFPEGKLTHRRKYRPDGKLTHYWGIPLAGNTEYEQVDCHYDQGGNLLTERKVEKNPGRDTPLLVGLQQTLRNEEGSPLIEVWWRGRGEISRSQAFYESVWQYDESGRAVYMLTASPEHWPAVPPHFFDEASGRPAGDRETVCFEQKEGKWQVRDGMEFSGIEYEYNAEGRLAVERSFRNHDAPYLSKHYTYDEAGRIVKFRQIDSQSAFMNYEQEYHFDAEGRKTGWTIYPQEGSAPRKCHVVPSKLVEGGYVSFDNGEKVAKFTEDCRLRSYEEWESGTQIGESWEWAYDEKGNLVFIRKFLEGDFWYQEEYRNYEDPFPFTFPEAR